MAETESGSSLADKEDLWGRLLGSKLDRIDDEERTVPRLIRKFCENKVEIVRYHYQSVDHLIAKIDEAPTEEAEQILLFLWAEYEWRNNRTGTEFRLNHDFDSELSRLRDEDNIVQKLSERLALVWAGQDKRRDLKESDSIRNTVQTEARPVFLRLSSNGDRFEVRGPARLLGTFEDELSQSEEVEAVERELTDEPILDNLSSFFEIDLELLTLIEAKFHSTNLPEGSSMVLRNTNGISGDLRKSDLDSNYIDTDNLADLEYLKFRHEKFGVQVKISIEHGQQGIYFDIDDSNLPEDEKQNIRDILKDKVGVSIDDLYPFDTEYHREHILNRILAEDADVYRKYYEKLDESSKSFVDRFVHADGDDILWCFNCDRGYWAPDNSADICNECGTWLMRGKPSLSVEVDRERILESVAERFSEFNDDITGPDGTRLLDVEFEEDEISSNTYLKSTFHLTETAGTASGTHWYEYFIYCLGNGDLPQRVNDYLWNTVLITYGTSQLRGRDNFGTISLYDLFEDNDTEHRIVEAIRESQSKLRKRVREKAEEAQENLLHIQQLVDEGVIENASLVKREELKAEYDHEDFERDIFYLLKSMFLFTERWGREGKKETDGCLIIPQGDGDYFVASYDPKLTYDIQGYDINAEEKNKAAYYVLSENNHDYISNVLKQGGHIGGHIFVSDLFREGQFQHVSDTVRDWFSLTSDMETSLDVPLAFLYLESLLDLYRVFDANYHFIIEYPRVHEAFRSEIQNQLSTSNKWVVFDESSVENVEERVLEARSAEPKKKMAKQYSDSS